MTTKKHTRAAFTAKLLAPLPAGVEQVDSEAFRKTLQSDQRAQAKAAFAAMTAAWEPAEMALKFAQHESSADMYRWILAGRKRSDDPCHRHAAIIRDARRGLLMTPAPGRTALRWKQHWAKHFPNDAEVIASLAADEVRIAPKQEA